MSSDLRILITGSRDFEDFNLAREALLSCYNYFNISESSQVTVVHGGARGADSILGYVAKQLGCHVEVHKADWNMNGKSAGLIRNIKMVSLGADVVLAFPVGKSSGTRHCIQQAAQHDLPVVNVTESNDYKEDISVIASR